MVLYVTTEKKMKNQSTAGSLVIATCRIMQTLFKVIVYIGNTDKLCTSFNTDKLLHPDV